MKIVVGINETVTAVVVPTIVAVHEAEVRIIVVGMTIGLAEAGVTASPHVVEAPSIDAAEDITMTMTTIIVTAGVINARVVVVVVLILTAVDTTMITVEAIIPNRKMISPAPALMLFLLVFLVRLHQRFLDSCNSQWAS